MIWEVYKLYCLLYYVIKHVIGINLRGIGVLSDFIKTPNLFYFKKCVFYFNPLCNRNYCLLPAGVPNEPETHIFLENIIKASSDQITFIDIGASIGEFVIPLAKFDKVKACYAFEPNEEAAKSIVISALINNLGDKIIVSTSAVSSYDGEGLFYLNTKSPTGSKLVADPQQSMKYKVVKVSKLDSIFQNQFLMLIDVEGSELEVLKGGREFILRNNPLIIFEYNEVTKSVFKLEQVYELFPKNQWALFRLRKDGLLDQNFSYTWNLVLCNKNSVFYKICLEMLK